MLSRILATIERHRMFPPGECAGVAVSGGADSVCLLHALVELGSRLGIRLAVLHLDHQLRGEESRGDAAFVAEMAASLGLPCHVERVDVAAADGNLEQAARDARRDFFRRSIAAGIAGRVATGHTRNDQAETVLFRFLRGSGSAGLAGIRPVTAEGIVRPLLEVGREEVEEWLRARGISWREDSSNASLEFARNRIRHGLLPQLVREWNPSLVETLAHTSEWAQAEEEYWDGEAGRLADTLLEPAGDAVLLDVRRLEGLPEAAARRLVRRAVERVKGDLRGFEFAHVAAVLALARLQEASGRFRAAGVDAFRSFDLLRIAPAAAGPDSRPDFALPLRVPGVTRLPSGGVVTTELIENTTPKDSSESVYNGNCNYLDWERVCGSLTLRNWRPGDRYRPIGHTGNLKIKELFHHARIPLWERRHWPLVTCGDTILWVRKFGPAAESVAGAASQRLLRIEEAGIGTGMAGV